MQIVSPDSLESPHVLAIARWYRGARQGTDWPPRAAFRPEALPPATLPHIGLVDVEPEPFRVFYRVLGESITVGLGGSSVRMRYLDELDWPQRDDLIALWRQTYEEAGPHFLRGTQTIGSHSFVFESCALPLGESSDAVRRYLVCEDYLDTEAWRQAVAQRRYRLRGRLGKPTA